jgi:hypothetical protein
MPVPNKGIEMTSSAALASCTQPGNPRASDDSVGSHWNEAS